MGKQYINAQEHILVCLSSAPSNPKIIQTAAAMAKAFNATFSALYVKTPASESMTTEDAERLLANTRFAETNGASIVTVCGDDIAFQIAEYARLSGVTKIVIGRTVIGKRKIIGKPTLIEKLISLAPDVDIHIIPDSDAVVSERKKKLFEKPHFVNTQRIDGFNGFTVIFDSTRVSFFKSRFYRSKYHYDLYARRSDYRYTDKKQNLLGSFVRCERSGF